MVNLARFVGRLPSQVPQRRLGCGRVVLASSRWKMCSRRRPRLLGGQRPSPVADARGAGHGALGQRRGKRHARRASEERDSGADAGAQGRFLEQHDAPGTPGGSGMLWV